MVSATKSYFKEDEPKGGINMGKSKRSVAAKKAAATRKANALAKKRSAAAKKAAATRKANALAKKRSEAAKKAWKTRRGY